MQEIIHLQPATCCSFAKSNKEKIKIQNHKVNKVQLYKQDHAVQDILVIIMSEAVQMQLKVGAA